MNTKFVHKLTRTHDSLYLVIPAEIARKYGWRAKQKMTIEDKGRGEVVIKDWKKK